MEAQLQRPQPAEAESNETSLMIQNSPVRPVEPEVCIGPDTDRKMSLDTPRRVVGSTVSIDDPDVRMAAQALGDLRADFIQSSPRRHSSPSPSSAGASQQPANGVSMTTEQQEPLLSLLTTSHPLLSTAIHGSLSAYSSSKSYSPRFRYGAEFVERHIGSPVVSTVGSVGRRTGVEGGVRWWLKSRRSSQAQESAPGEVSEVAAKRRKVSNGEHNDIDVEQGLGTTTSMMNLPAYAERRPSEASFAESLPAYDDNRSPNYYEAQGGALVPTTQASDETSANSSQSTWQSRLMLSTSGLGVAMSEESLRSLRYCLTWLRWANLHLGKVVVTLKELVEQWDASSHDSATTTTTATANHNPPAYAPLQVRDTSATTATDDAAVASSAHPGAGAAAAAAPTGHAQTSLILPQPLDRERITQRIQALKSEVLHTLKHVVDIVSKYAGGALPENARSLVRHYLTSLPQRFHTASAAAAAAAAAAANHSDAALLVQPAAASHTIASAHRVIVLAKEGLDMMAQVSHVLDGTIASAEDWCDRLGRRKTADDELLAVARRGGAAAAVNDDRKAEPAAAGDVKPLDRGDGSSAAVAAAGSGAGATEEEKEMRKKMMMIMS